MRAEMISVLKQHFEAHILKHKMNVDIMLNNPMAIHDHTDLMEAVEKEVAHIAEFMDKLEVMEKYFDDSALPWDHYSDLPSPNAYKTDEDTK